MLADMTQRRNRLDEAITRLEYELANPSPPINYDRVMNWVAEKMAESRQMEERRYKELIGKEEAGILSHGEEALLKRYKGVTK